MPTIDYGTDLACLDDLEEECRVISDPRTVLAHAIVRRWSTPRGTLPDDENYGTDLSENINEDFDALTMARVSSDARAEALKETERVVDCTIFDEAFDATTERLTFKAAIEATESASSLTLTVAVSALNVTLLNVE